METVLYPFCAGRGKTCPDGANPGTGVILDTVGGLYGTTTIGGTHVSQQGQAGTVFELTPNAGRRNGCIPPCSTAFACKAPPPELRRRRGPDRRVDHGHGGAPLRRHRRGRRTAAVSSSTWPQTRRGPNGRRGFSTAFVRAAAHGARMAQAPKGGLVMDRAGHLLGTTSGGGTHQRAERGGGTVFELP
jgi:hypothetical protein